MYKIICVLFIILFGCRNGNPTEIEYTCKLELSEDKIFHLDSETSQMTNIIQLFTENDTIFFSFANEYDNSIVIYDYLSGNFISKLKFDKEGSDGVGNFTSYYYHSNDSIFIFYQWYGKLFILDKQTRKYDELDFNIPSYSSKELNPPSIYPLTRAPIRKISNFLVCTGVQSSDDNKQFRPSTVLYDFYTNEIRFANNLPDIYMNKSWGNLFAYKYACTTFNNNTMVLSYGADHYITVYNIEKDENKSFYAGTKHYSEIKPSRLQSNTNFEDEDIHYMNNLCYRNILFDEYRNIYYRFVFLPHPNYDREDRYLRRPFSVIILDSDFNIIGETLLPEFEYLIAQTFVSPDGLHVQVMSDNDDFMVFKTFKITEL